MTTPPVIVVVIVVVAGGWRRCGGRGRGIHSVEVVPHLSEHALDFAQHLCCFKKKITEKAKSKEMLSHNTQTNTTTSYFNSFVAESKKEGLKKRQACVSEQKVAEDRDESAPSQFQLY